MTKVIVITSGKGGVGKTSLTVNAAVELGRRKYKTCLFDADLGLANANILLGLHPDKTLDSYVMGNEKLCNIIQDTGLGFDIIPGSSGVEKMANLVPEQLSSIIADFAALREYDHFLIDTSSGISRGVISFCLAADETILVITAEPTSLTDAYAVLKVLSLNQYRGTVRILVNRCRSIPQSKETYLHFKSVADKHLSIQIAPIGAVIQDPNMENALSNQRPILTLFPESIASQCIRAMVINIVGDSGKIDDESRFRSFWTNYFSYLQRQETTENSAHSFQKQNKANTSAPTPTANFTSSSAGRTEISGKKFNVLPLPDIPTAPAPPDQILLESPPQLFLYLLELKLQGKLGRTEIETVVNADPVLTLALLKYYTTCIGVKPVSVSLPNTGSIIGFLGTEPVSKWLIDRAVQSVFSESKKDHYEFLTQFWHNSLNCAVLSNSLARSISDPAIEGAFQAGLLCNIGRMVLQLSSPDLYMTFQNLDLKGKALWDSERRYFGMDHGEFGASVLKGFHVGSLIEDCARYRTINQNSIKTALPLTRLVYVASRLLTDDHKNDASLLGQEVLSIAADKILELKREAISEVQSRLKLFNTTIETEKHEISTRKKLKKLIQNYLSIESILPGSFSKTTKRHPFQWLYSGMAQLFELDCTIWLSPDPTGQYLKVTGSPPCLPDTFSTEIQLVLKSKSSIIVGCYHSGEIIATTSSELKSIADRQILGVLAAETLLSIPLVFQGQSFGIVVAGLNVTNSTDINRLIKRIEPYSYRAAETVAKQTISEH